MESQEALIRGARKLGYCLLLGGLGLSASACSSQEYRNGEATVVQHVYDDEDVQGGRFPVTDPEHFQLYLEQCGFNPQTDDKADEKGCKVFPYEVTETVYESVSDGDKVRLRVATDGRVIFEKIQ